MLTPRQQRFAAEYLVDLNATQAAQRAGYSERTAYAQGQRLLHEPVVSALISQLLDERSKRLEVTADRVVAELAKLAFADPRSLFDANGALLPIHLIPPEVAQAIATMEVTTDTGGTSKVTKIRFCDKVAALTLLARHLGMLNDKLSVTDGQELIDRIQRGRARVAAATSDHASSAIAGRASGNH